MTESTKAVIQLAHILDQFAEEHGPDVLGNVGLMFEVSPEYREELYKRLRDVEGTLKSGELAISSRPVEESKPLQEMYEKSKTLQ